MSSEPVRLAATWTRSLGLLATHTLTFFFAGSEGSAVGEAAGLARVDMHGASRIAAVANGGLDC